MSIFRNLKALFGSGERPSARAEMFQELDGIIQAYGKVLEERSLSSSFVVDSNKLPFSKERIKGAILAAMQVNQDPAQQKALATGYIFLADFQDGVGDTFVGLNLEGMNTSDYNIEELAKSISEQQPDFDKWIPIIEKEQVQLLAELKTVGYEK